MQFVLKYEKILLFIRRIHHIKTYLINDIDHMNISGTEPSSVILIYPNKEISKVEKGCPISAEIR